MSYLVGLRFYTLPDRAFKIFCKKPQLEALDNEIHRQYMGLLNQSMDWRNFVTSFIG